MKVQARVFVIAVTLFIFLPVTWVILREVRYRAKNGDTPIPTTTTDTTHKDSTIAR